MKENNVKNKSFAFAVRIVKLNQYQTKKKREYVMAKQILRSGTAVGAMVREAEHGQSKADFIHKFAIAQKEINETIYWLELLKATDYIDENYFNSLNMDAVELIKIITAIIKNTKRNLTNN